MNKLMKFTNGFRIAIYSTILCVGLITACNEIYSFWPPDLVPHPHPVPDEPERKEPEFV